MRIIGIHDGHNASVAFVENGRLKFAIQEERFNLIKNYWGFPFLSLNFLFSKFKLNNNNIDAIVFSSKYSPNLPKGKGREELLSAFRNDKTILSVLRNRIVETNLYKTITFQKLREIKSVKANMSNRISILKKNYNIPLEKIHFIDHHLSHASAVYYGLRNDNSPCLILTLDGGGDGLCSTVSIGKDGRINRIAETPAGHSIGNIYSRVTFIMGFIPWEHEYKLMGMAGYVNKSKSKSVARIFQSYLDLDKDNPLMFKRKIPESTLYISKRLKEDLDSIRFDHICGGLQFFTEELIIKWVKECIKKTGLKKIFCAGGVFMNVKVNKRILELPEVESISIFPSCGDETNSIGAAFFFSNQHGETPERISHFYTGFNFSDEDIEKQLKKVNFQYNFQYRYFDDINDKIADLLADGEIVARCSGAMEFGARALGNRSILADPSRYDCIRVINIMVKKRDFWMPFAPVIKEERQHEYIHNPKNQESPYMMLSFDTTEKRKEFIAAVHSGDLTARAQILSYHANPSFYDLLTKYEAKTGRGVLLNTSFNLHGYPIVLGPQEAINVFVTSGLKYLAIGNYLVWK